MIMISSRRPLFWILLSATTLAGIAFTYHYFSRAFPIANIDLKVNRSQMLEKGSELAQQYSWGQPDFRQTAAFEHDSYVQLYVELEVGGNEAFAQMLQENLYSPFTWHVRRFKEGETNEVNIFFKPDGTPYGFEEKIAELTPGAHLTSVEARTIAEDCATQHWGINLEEYGIIETSQETRPNGRIDHTFVYERPTLQIGEGRYRLALGVTGDKCTKLRHFIKIPEGFNLRYDEMRSKNKNLATVGWIFIFLYLAGGCAYGLLLLNRQRWVIWSMPLMVASLFALLIFLSMYNQLPLAWMGYDTALPIRSFLFRYFLQSIMNMCQMFIFFGLTFSAAESLTRKAFGHHIQFWKLWNRDVAASWQVLGRTVGAYLFALVDLAFIVGTYFIARKTFGWWLPSDHLVDPNILATYIPWLSPFCNALQAGFWEECLFRAIPLSCASLIGQRFGRRNLCLGIGIVVQGLIFGAAHANYLQQPFYARVVEMFLPCLAWAGIYLVFGLMSVIIIHFIYDLILMSLPLFISTASGSLFNQLMIIILGFIPLSIVLYARFRTGAFKDLQKRFYNAAWKPSSIFQDEEVSYTNHTSEPLNKKHAYTILVVATCAMIAWIFSKPWTHDEISLNINSSQAITVADKELMSKHIELPTSWRTLPTISAQPSSDSRFIWQNANKNTYSDLMASSFIKPPHWMVRYATFEGDLEDRAEQYFISAGPQALNENDNILRMQHILPEKRPGAQLTEEQARKLVQEHVSSIISLGTEEKDYREISAAPTKHPNRTDWVFTYEKNDGELKDGTLRVSVAIAGDAVTDTNMFVHIPEQWERDDRNERMLMQTLIGTAGFIYTIVWVIVLVYLLLFVQSPLHNTLYFFALISILYLLQIILGLPVLMFGLKTSQPIASQLFRTLIFSIIGVFAATASQTLLFSFVRKQTVTKKKNYDWLTIGTAIGLGIILQSIIRLGQYTGSWFNPVWASYDAAGFYFPALATAGLLISRFIALSLFMVAFILLINYFGRNKSNIVHLLTFLILGIVTSPVDASVQLWFTTGLAMGSFYYLAYRYVLATQPQLTLWFYATSLTMSAMIQLMYHAYPGALVGNIVGIVGIWFACLYLYQVFNKGQTAS